MTKIPADVREAAMSAYMSFNNEQTAIAPAPTEDELLQVCARAIMVERERCAKIADIFAKTKPTAGPQARLVATIMAATGAAIAESIRGTE